jgi:hypothetical protein
MFLVFFWLRIALYFWIRKTQLNTNIIMRTKRIAIYNYLKMPHPNKIIQMTYCLEIAILIILLRISEATILSFLSSNIQVRKILQISTPI